VVKSEEIVKIKNEIDPKNYAFRSPTYLTISFEINETIALEKYSNDKVYSPNFLKKFKLKSNNKR
jgi:hypothetical protein